MWKTALEATNHEKTLDPRGRTGAALDLGATLAGRSGENLSKMPGLSDRHLTEGIVRS